MKFCKKKVYLCKLLTKYEVNEKNKYLHQCSVIGFGL